MNKHPEDSGAPRPASPTKPDPYAPLRVITRLTVGPVRVDKNRISAPYRVERPGHNDTTHLVYSYEEDVFSPGDPLSRNLAAMIAAQVAINYGLFCDEIVFHGPYDKIDQQFIEDMARNTAREIIVKKFLEPNPFLHGDAAKLTPVKLDNFLYAKLVFDAPTAPAEPPEAAERAAPASQTSSKRPLWRTDRQRHLILSSGGKDSLLTYGLLSEMNREVHPVFVNESGKHWFTALNAYREFKTCEANTGRVWTNADRVFAWMIRHLPFIRGDFLKVRSDEYPIRLWTVAVFLFGVLPVARRRGCGRILIGDEYDTTEKRQHEGITHYSGLFDQSRYFDNILTRYYARKGWGLSQFSILRPMSEQLIQKTLVERYPELFRHQVSCHAAHSEGDRVRPCGNCEKCRRIVGMVMAFGSDPQVCGYTPEQVERSLKSLITKGIHQEEEGVEHLGYLLSEKKLLPEGGIAGKPAKPRPHVLQLRFDPEHSPIDSIPVDLRRPLYKLLLQHAGGAVQKNGRVWVQFNPLAAEIDAKPYPFEAPVASPPAKGGPGGVFEDSATPAAPRHRCDYILGHLTWPEAQDMFKKVDVALLPVGAIEQHGPHLPLDTDAFDAQYLAEHVAEACSQPRPIVLPLIPYGVSYHHEDFSGTISLSNETMSKLVYEIGTAAARNGITKLIIINGHGGNAASLHFAAQMINRDAHIFTTVDTGETSDDDISAIAETAADIHAGEIETSTTLAVRPEFVRMDKARKNVPQFSSKYLDFSSKRGLDWYARTAKISRSGVMGDPTKASREKGEKMWDVMIKNLVEFVEHLKGMSLDEIHQRNRY